MNVSFIGFFKSDIFQTHEIWGQISIITSEIFEEIKVVRFLQGQLYFPNQILNIPFS
jgi:ubiquinone biosynthesis protein Coq4